MVPLAAAPDLTAPVAAGWQLVTGLVFVLLLSLVV